MVGIFDILVSAVFSFILEQSKYVAGGFHMKAFTKICKKFGGGRRPIAITSKETVLGHQLAGNLISSVY